MELEIKLANGGTLRCGPGEDHEWGGYVRICDPDGNEILYWSADEYDESAIGAAFAASVKSIKELTKDRKLVDGVWVWKKPIA